MRFLADQDLYKVTIDQLKRWGHDVVTVRELRMQRTPDEDLLKKTKEENRLLITRDKDFGTLVFLNKTLSTGVILLKIAPTIIEEVHQEVDRFLKEHSEEDLRYLFCVVEPHRHRIRHLR
jgi:predicted nuclease of predicted toxin-antitoxin system